MRKCEKIGLIAGVTGLVGVLVHTAMKKSFRSGFEVGANVALKTADDTVNTVIRKYNDLAQTYNELSEEYDVMSEEYFDLLDEIEISNSDEETTEE